MNDDAVELPLLLAAGAGEPEALLLVARPRSDGRVLVRGWTGRDWSRGPESSEREAAELLADLERAARMGRQMRPELSAVRDWLGRG